MPSAEELHDEGRRLVAAWQAEAAPGLLDAAVEDFGKALAMPWRVPGDRLRCVIDLVSALSERLRLRPGAADTDAVISLLGEALSAVDDPWLHGMRARYLMARYLRRGSLADLTSAVRDFKKAYVEAARRGGGEVYPRALDMAWACEARFDRLRGRGEDYLVVQDNGVERWRGPRDLVLPIQVLSTLLAVDRRPSVPGEGLPPPPPELVPRLKRNLANLLCKYAVDIRRRPPGDRAQDWVRAVDLLREALDETPAGSGDYVTVISSLLAVLQAGRQPGLVPGAHDVDPALFDRMSAALEGSLAAEADPVIAAVARLNLAGLLMAHGRTHEAVRLYRELSSGPLPAPPSASPESIWPGPGQLATPVSLQAASNWAASALARGAWDEVVEARARVATLTAALLARQQDWPARYVWSAASGQVAGMAAFALARLGRVSEAAAVLGEGRTITLAERLSSGMGARPGFGTGAKQGSYPAGTTLYLVATPAGSVALRCDDGGEWSNVWLPGLAPEPMAKRVARYAEALDAFHRNAQLGVDAWMLELDDMLGFLREALRPLVQELPPGDVTVIPVGVLALLPVGAALLDDPPSRGVSILPGLGLRPAAAPGTPDRALIVADPALRWAGWEQTAVSAFFSHLPAVPSDASPQAVLDALPPHGVAHFACHATVDLGSPWESRLQLPGGGKLTVGHILQGQLPPLAMVVISACETGLPDPYSVDEGIGLPAAFLAATNASVVSTLWKVNDVSTALLILRFYWEWQHERAPASLALARAQRWQGSTTADEKCAFVEKESVAAGVFTAAAAETMTAEIRRRSGPGAANPFRHPYHWAAFTYSGR